MTEHDAELRTALRQLPVPEPSPDLPTRILRNRAMGVRVSLPARRLSVPWRWLAAAAVVTLFIAGSWMLSVSVVEIRESRVGARDPLGELLSGRLWRSGEERSSEPLSLPETLEPKYPLILSGSLDLSRLSEGVWTYQSITTTDEILAEPSFNAGERLRMTRGSYGGQPAWLVETAGRSGGQPWSAFAETLYIDAATLRPRYGVWHWNKNRSRLEERFSGGRGFQSITITGPMEPFLKSGIMELTFPLDALFTNDWQLEQQFRMVVPAIPFAKGWQGSVYQTGLFAQTGPATVKPRAFPLNLRVVGSDRVSVPAGRFECWRVEVESYIAGVDAWTMWVSRDKGWVVKTESRGSDYVRNDVLVSYEPGS